MHRPRFSDAHVECEESQEFDRQVRLLQSLEVWSELPVESGRCQDFWLIVVSIIPISAGPKGMVAPKADKGQRNQSAFGGVWAFGRSQRLVQSIRVVMRDVDAR